MQSILKIALPVLLAGTITTACQTVQTTHGGAVGVQRSQLMMVSAQEVEQASSQQYQQMVAEARRKNALDRDPATVQRVRRIVSRLTAQTGAFRPDAPSWAWEVHVFSSNELNAWCMAGGKMAIYTGLIQRLALSDDEIAAVMGHEIAHALREHETEAVRMGVELAARAGYDPRAAVTLWNKMAGQSAGAPPQWLSTHPSHATRQKDLAEYAARVMPLYQGARR